MLQSFVWSLVLLIFSTGLLNDEVHAQARGIRPPLPPQAGGDRRPGRRPGRGLVRNRELRRTTGRQEMGRPRGNERSKRVDQAVGGLPAYGGNGCPQGTARVSFAPDNLSFSILLDRFVAETDGSDPNARTEMNCDLLIPIQIPENTQMEITRVDLRGFVNLPANTFAQLASTFNFRDRGGDFNRMVLSQRFGGPLAEDYFVTSDILAEDGRSLAQSEVSPCGGVVQLSITNRVRIVSRSPSERASITLDSIDGAGEAVYFINWQECQP